MATTGWVVAIDTLVRYCLSYEKQFFESLWKKGMKKGHPLEGGCPFNNYKTILIPFTFILLQMLL